MINWLNFPKVEVFCSRDELMDCKKLLLWVIIYKGDLRKCIIKKFKHTKTERECYNIMNPHALIP